MKSLVQWCQTQHINYTDREELLERDPQQNVQPNEQLNDHQIIDAQPNDDQPNKHQIINAQPDEQPNNHQRIKREREEEEVIETPQRHEIISLNSIQSALNSDK